VNAVPPRLIHLADYTGSYSGSFIPMLLASAKAARKHGWSVELVFSELPAEKPWLEEVERVGIPHRIIDAGTRTGIGRWASWLAAEATWGLWRGRLTREVDALLAESPAPTILHATFSAFDVASAHAARRVGSAHVVWHEQSMRRPGWKPKVGGIVNYRVFARNVEEILCVGPDLTALLRRIAPARHVRFFPNAVDAELFSPAGPDARRAARERLGLEPDVFVPLHFGWQWERKGGDLYLAAVDALVEAEPARGIQAVTVGRGAAAAVGASRPRPYITVLEATENVRELYAAADVFVSPSRSEGMPFAVLEALSSGLPVVASDIPGQAFVGKAVSACRLTELSAEGVASALRDVLRLSPEERARDREAARRWILEEMDLARWGEKLVGIYDGLLAQASPRPLGPVDDAEV
jgi:glycosyltransferase involved in cell wall biosynthesis